MTGPSTPTARPAKIELASAAGELDPENSPLDSPHSRSPGLRPGSDVIESTETTQLPLHQNNIVGVYVEEQNAQSVEPFSDIQDNSCLAHISADDVQSQLEHAGPPHIPPFNNDQSSASPGIHDELVRSAVDESEESRSIYGPIFDSTQVPDSTGALVLHPKPLDEGIDCASHGTVRPSPDSTSDSHGSVIANTPRISMDDSPQPNSMRPIPCDRISRSQPTDASLRSAMRSRDQHTDRCSEPAAMPSQSLIPPKRTIRPDLSIFPLEPTDSYLLTAVASGLQELQELSASPDDWIGPQNVSSSDQFTVLGIKPLGDERWLLLAKVSHQISSGSCLVNSREEAVEHQPQPKSKRKTFGAMNVDTDSEWDECATLGRRTKSSRIARQKITSVKTRKRGASGNSADAQATLLKRGNWEEDEDLELTRLVELGTPWPSILTSFPHRREGAVKSRWYCVLKPLFS